MSTSARGINPTFWRRKHENRVSFHIRSRPGWLHVKRKELEALGILDIISSYSYQRGGMVYLEEDDDATKFLRAKKAINQPFTIKEKYVERTSIRSYESFSKGP